VAGDGELKTEELTAIINGIRDRVRARYPQGTAGSVEIPLPDLLPIVHARDAAEAKVAAIGTVNPRPPGAVNSIIQFVKRQVARALDWHVREQVEFNRAAMSCIEALLGALNESNRALTVLAAELDRGGLRDLQGNWSEWRQGWERRVTSSEAQILRTVSDLHGAYQARVASVESSFRDLVNKQHAGFEDALESSGAEIQKKLWADLEKIRLEYERLIHVELRLLRQRAAAAPSDTLPRNAAQPLSAPAETTFDYTRFAERFRGSEEYVKNGQRFYRPFFEGRKAVLDIGCGRGEFLELMREIGVPARGIELSAESVAVCRAKDLEAEQADLFEYLPGRKLDGIFCAQVVEHLAPERIPEFVRLAAGALEPHGILAIETPNPECLAIFATHFYIDPTHTRPIPPALMAFYLEEAGFGQIEVHRLSPAIESMLSLGTLPQEFREAFFGGLDYAVIGRKL
jgi:O-antigen chain-terminating methyltransferase